MPWLSWLLPRVQVSLHLSRVPDLLHGSRAAFKGEDYQDASAEHKPQREAAHTGTQEVAREGQGEAHPLGFPSARLQGHLGALGLEHRTLCERGQ